MLGGTKSMDYSIVCLVLAAPSVNGGVLESGVWKVEL